MHLYCLTITALLAVVPTLVQAQCNFNRACTIGPNQRCPTGCSRTEFCTKTTTKTLAPSTVTSVVTTTGTITSATTITVTASTSSIVPPACKTEVPYANLFTFPDNECKNATDLLLGIPLTVRGLTGPPIKFNTLTPNPATKYNESSCITLPTTDDGARSIYFTVDGIPEDPFPSCTLNLYRGIGCQGDGNNDPVRYQRGGANKCQAAPDNVPWRSVQFKCVYRRDVCTDAQIFAGTCIKF